MQKWQLVDYYDVWEDEEGLPYVNDIAKLDIITLPEDFSDRELFDYLIKIGYFNPTTRFDDVEFSGDDYFVEFYEADSQYPLGRIEYIDDESADFYRRNGTHMLDENGERV